MGAEHSATRRTHPRAPAPRPRKPPAAEPDGYCRNGGIWQTSSAGIPPAGGGNWTCEACDLAGCDQLKNPVCGARITFEFAKLMVDPIRERACGVWCCACVVCAACPLLFISGRVVLCGRCGRWWRKLPP